MLEDELRELFSAQAAASLPPGRISLPAVRRRAAARRHRRNLAAVGSPVLAACAVLAVALAGLTPFSHGGIAAHNRGNGTQQHAACGQVTAAHASDSSGDGAAAQGKTSNRLSPAQFSLLVPYAAFGWLPGSACALSGQTSPTEDYVQLQGLGLDTFANGVCDRTAHGSELACPIRGYRIKLYGRAPAVNGHPAYFADKPSQPSLAWQYAPGGWTILWNNAYGPQPLRTMVRIADGVIFGDFHQQPIKFAVQITNPLAHVGGPIVLRHYFLRSGALLADEYSLVRDGTTRFTILISVGTRCDSGPFKHTIINGYHVQYESRKRDPREWTTVCSEARGLRIIMYGPGSTSAWALTIFRSLKILGTNQSNWVTQPVS